MPPAAPLLAVESLRVEIARPGAAALVPVRDVSFTVERGEAVGLVGASGSGKTLTALALLGLLPPGARAGGRAVLGGEVELLGLSEPERRRLRGRRVALVFQEPATALNPVLPLGFQLREVLALHRGLRGEAARREARRWLDRVAMPEGARRLDAFAHQLSGGQRQRAMLALALAGEPELLIADEPTTALDVCVQARILDLLGDLRRELGIGLVLITHDLAVVAEACDRLAVMARGEVIETAAAAAFFAGPRHPEAQALLARVPRLPEPAP